MRRILAAPVILRDWDFEFRGAPLAWAVFSFASGHEDKVRAAVGDFSGAAEIGSLEVQPALIRFSIAHGLRSPPRDGYRAVVERVLADRRLPLLRWEISGDGGIRIRSGTSREALVDYLREPDCSLCGASVLPAGRLFGPNLEEDPRICASCVRKCLATLAEPETQVARFTACSFCETDFGNGVQARPHLFMGIREAICRLCLEAASTLERD